MFFSRAFLASFVIPTLGFSSFGLALTAEQEPQNLDQQVNTALRGSKFLLEDVQKFNRFKRAVFKELPSLENELDQHLLQDLANPPYSHHRFALYDIQQGVLRFEHADDVIIGLQSTLLDAFCADIYSLLSVNI